MIAKSPLRMAGVALLAFSVIGCGAFGGLGRASHKADSKKACAGFSRDYRSVDGALADLEKLRGKSFDAASSTETYVVFMDFLTASRNFDPALVIEHMTDSVKSAVTGLHDSLGRVQDDLSSRGARSKPDIRAALSDGERVSTDLAGLKSACGQS